jgi:TatD DNase family protein
MGFYIGVGGVVTFMNARKLVETVKEIPLGRILLETDCPYLAPVPFRGKRNSSLYLPFVVSRIAEIKGITEEEVIRTTERNAEMMYGLT